MNPVSTYTHSVFSRYSNKRLLSLDVLRGLAVVAMIVVNTPGDWAHVYAPLLHASWNGWTPTDIIFPAFLFIMGMSIVASGLDTKTPDLKIFASIGSRALKLFGLGLLIAVFYYPFGQEGFNWWESQVETIRIMGVLQRIALVYVICTVVVLYSKPMSWLITAAALCAAYWGMMLYAPYSVFGLDMTGTLVHGNNFAAYVDDFFLGRDHVYYDVIVPFAYDPEGLLSTLSATSSALIGAVCAKFFLNREPSSLFWVALAGIVCFVLGDFLSEQIMVNKTLWTPSYVLISAGVSLIITAAAILILDQLNIRGWSAPFVVCGTNAIAIYVLAALLARLAVMIPVGETSLQGWLYTVAFQPMFGDKGGSLAYAIGFLLVCYLPIHAMYKRGIFLKV